MMNSLLGRTVIYLELQYSVPSLTSSFASIVVRDNRRTSLTAVSDSDADSCNSTMPSEPPFSAQTRSEMELPYGPMPE